MKKLRILGEILRRTHADKILLGFVAFLFIDAFLIMLVEPDITHYGDSIWYCYVALATIGFGDIVAKTFIGRVLTILLSLYATLVIAIVTGVIANYYMQIIQIRQKETLANLMDRLESLPEMSKDELQEISNKVKHFRNS
jgi:voltage-gated potassium channel